MKYSVNETKKELINSVVIVVHFLLEIEGSEHIISCGFSGLIPRLTLRINVSGLFQDA